MAVDKVLARGFTIEIENHLTAGTFIPLGGILSFQLTSEKTDADVTTFDSQGWDEHIVAKRGKGLTINMKYLEDKVTGDRDAGQSEVEYYANLLDDAALANWKLTTPGGTTHTFKASVNIATIGGGNEDGADYNIELKISGAVTTA